MTGDAGRPDDTKIDIKTYTESESLINGVSEHIVKIVEIELGDDYSHQDLGAALKRASILWDTAAEETIPKEGEMNRGSHGREPHESPRSVEEAGLPPRSVSLGEGVLYQDAAAWVFISAFIGLASAWGSGLMAPWAGALIGAAFAYLAAAFAIACRG